MFPRKCQNTGRRRAIRIRCSACPASSPPRFLPPPPPVTQRAHKPQASPEVWKGAVTITGTQCAGVSQPQGHRHHRDRSVGGWSLRRAQVSPSHLRSGRPTTSSACQPWFIRLSSSRGQTRRRSSRGRKKKQALRCRAGEPVAGALLRHLLPLPPQTASSEEGEGGLLKKT